MPLARIVSSCYHKPCKKIIIKIRRHDHEVKVRYNQLPVSQRFQVFVECRVSVKAQEALAHEWEQLGLELLIRDLTYVEKTMQEPLAFVCHDFRDKDNIARPLAKKLQELAGPIWYDEFSLKIGDSLREKIEEGLRTSNYCVLVLSKNFLKNRSWARREFDTGYAKEIVTGTNVFLPVWVDVCRQDIYDFSPILADRVGISWDKGVEAVAQEISVLLRCGD